MQNHKSQLKSKKTVREILQSICAYKGKNKGLTLIEVIISLALFSILAIPVAGFVNTTVQTNKKAEVKQQATLLGQSILEELASVDKLVVGVNQLFGKTDVEILEGADACDASQYCMKGLELEGFSVDLEFDLLSQNKETELGVFSFEPKLNEKNEEVSLFIEFSNNFITIESPKENSPINVQNKPKVSIFIDSLNRVSLQITSNNSQVSSYVLNGELTNGNVLIDMKTNNQKHSVEKLTVHNNGDFILQGCLENKEAGGHTIISEVNVIPEYKGNIKVLNGSEVCKFNNSELVPPEVDNEDNLMPPHVTDSLDLFEVQLKVYQLDSTDLLFKGTRVLPLNFE